MRRSQIITGEVVSTLSAFDEIEDQLDPDQLLPIGTIFVKIKYTSAVPSTVKALPYSNTDIQVPKVGEIVTLIKSLSDNIDDIFSFDSAYYYLPPVNIHNYLHENKLPGISSMFQDENPGVYTDSTSISGNPPEIQSENLTPLVQPFQGDRLLQSRFGTIIRFSSNNTKSNEYNGNLEEKKIKFRSNNTLWTGEKPDNPILMITNGIDTNNETYTIENPEKDKSLIYLTSDQKIKINTSQTKLGLGTIPAKNYDKSQIILSADRLLFNSRDDYLILSGKKSVNIATPNWQMDMNKFFDLFDSFLDEVIKTARGESNYLTGVGPTGGNPTLLVGAQRIKTELFRMRQ